MPLTPFHLGPALLLGLVAYRRLNLPALLVASAIVDVRTLLAAVGYVGGPVHGIETTFLGATAHALAVAAAAYLVRGRARPLAAAVGLDQDWTAARILAGAALGAWSHVALDAILYAAVRPFYPLAGNPFLGLASEPAVYGFCVVCGLLGLALYALRVTAPDRFRAITA